MNTLKSLTFGKMTSHQWTGRVVNKTPICIMFTLRTYMLLLLLLLLFVSLLLNYKFQEKTSFRKLLSKKNKWSNKVVNYKTLHTMHSLKTNLKSSIQKLSIIFVTFLISVAAKKNNFKNRNKLKLIFKHC